MVHADHDKVQSVEISRNGAAVQQVHDKYREYIERQDKQMKLNIEKFMKTEMGGELEETIRCWDKAIEERKKVTPGLSSHTEEDKGMGYHYWNNTCKSCQDRWEVFKLAIHQFYGIEFFFTRTDEYFGICTEDETTWLMKEDRQQKAVEGGQKE